jgi:hypothetical protein
MESNNLGKVSAAVEEQMREANALSAPSKSTTTIHSILDRLKLLETRGEIPVGLAERIHQQAQLSLEEQERAADISARETEVKHLQGVTTWRRRAGYILMGLAGAAIPVVFALSTYQLHKFTALPADFPRDRFWLLVGGQAIVTFVTLYFLYQVLKASERLAMPYWWAERNPEVVRLMLGIEDIITASSRSAEQIARVVAPLSEPVVKLVDVATKLLDALKDKVKPGGT